MLTEGFSFADAFGFSIVTMATVGYGDIAPKTMAGKFLATFIIAAGIGTFLRVIAAAMDLLLDKREKVLDWKSST